MSLALQMSTSELVMSVSEFVAIRQLPKDALRSKFQLGASCDPIVSAIRGVRTDVVVVVSCREDDEERRMRAEPRSR